MAAENPIYAQGFALVDKPSEYVNSRPICITGHPLMAV
jgi:hypothetical protein